MIHGYLLAIFDIPSTEKEDRKNYNRLIKAFKTNGFKRLQESAFIKYQHNMKQANQVIAKFKEFKKLDGSLIFIPLVESQYKKIKTVVGAIPNIKEEEGVTFI